MFKKIFVSFVCVMIIVSSVCFATVPDPPKTSDTNAGVLFFNESNSTYFYADVDYNYKQLTMHFRDDGSLRFLQNGTLQSLPFGWYKLVNGEWTLLGSGYTYISSDSFPTFKIIQSTNDVYKDGGVFFQQASSLAALPLEGIHQVRELIPGMSETLKILIPVGLIILAVLFGTHLVPRLIALFLG